MPFLRRLILFTLISPFLFLSGYCQNRWQWGFGTGTVVYFGDLGNEKYVPLSGTHQGANIFLRRQLYNTRNRYLPATPFSMEAHATWLPIGYDETRPLWFSDAGGMKLRNFRRGLNFRNDLFGVNVRFVYSFYPWLHSVKHSRFAIYLFAGPGIFYSNPKGDLFLGAISEANRYYYWDDGTLRDGPQSNGKGQVIHRDGIYETRLRDWFTEGQSNQPYPGRKPIYHAMQIGIPHGGGLKFGLGRHTNFQFELCFYDFLSDYIDDVSNRYATVDQIATNFPNNQTAQQLDEYITDPSGWGSDGTDGPGTSIRGNPNKLDWLNYMNIQLVFDLNGGGSYHPRHHKSRGCPDF